MLTTEPTQTDLYGVVMPTVLSQHSYFSLIQSILILVAWLKSRLELTVIFSKSIISVVLGTILLYVCTHKLKDSSPLPSEDVKKKKKLFFWLAMKLDKQVSHLSVLWVFIHIFRNVKISLFLSWENWVLQFMVQLFC